jgi:hypothetical protein
MAGKGNLDMARKKLLALAEKAGYSLSALSTRLTYAGKPRARGYLHDYIFKASPRELRAEDVAILARILGIDSGELTVEPVRPHNANMAIDSKPKGNLTFIPAPQTGQKDLPILGHGRGGEAGFFIDQGKVWGFAVRPASLVGVAEAYAVRVYDTSMDPRYQPGEVLQVDPFRQVRPGDDVVIQLTDGQCFVKRLVRRAGGVVVCRQFNPPKDIQWKQDKVDKIHLVVGVDYLER